MQLSELLGAKVHDDSSRQLGTVIDVRLAVSGTVDREPGVPLVFGLVVSPRTRSSYLGYERSQVKQPAFLARLLRWRHRGTFLVLWTDVSAATAEGITVRRNHRRYSALLSAT